MASRTLKRYRLEGAAKILIAIGLLLILFAWFAGVYYFGITGKITLFIAPLIFTCVSALLLMLEPIVTVKSRLKKPMTAITNACTVNIMLNAMLWLFVPFRSPIR